MYKNARKPLEMNTKPGDKVLILADTETPNSTATVVDCTYFKTNIIALQDYLQWKKSKDAFTVFMCTNGQFELVFNGEIMHYQMGDTLLIPAVIDHLTLKGKATLLEISI
jgi:mannose-6-phosphate isomerase